MSILAWVLIVWVVLGYLGIWIHAIAVGRLGLGDIILAPVAGPVLFLIVLIVDTFEITIWKRK